MDDRTAPAESRMIAVPGQSGNPLSPHYADQLPLWRAGEAVTPAWHPDDVIRAAVETLRLFPKRE